MNNSQHIDGRAFFNLFLSFKVASLAYILLEMLFNEMCKNGTNVVVVVFQMIESSTLVVLVNMIQS